MSSSNEWALVLENVDYDYKKRGFLSSSSYRALNNICFKVRKGETLGIQGGNGSGKSTLLKLLAGIYEPTNGSIERFDNQVSLQTLSAGFDVQLSGQDNALIGAMLLGHSKKEALARQKDILAMSELGDKFFEPVKTYSAGMRARLGFATAITMETDVLLIDEVLGVGDVNFRKKARQQIKEKTSSNMTVIIVSHENQQIRSLCDRSIFIEKGEITSVTEFSAEG